MTMEFDIDIEINKLNKFLNKKEILSFKDYITLSIFKNNDKVGYLLYVLELTYDNSKIETYLQQLLENFTVEELNNLSYGYNILHYMVGELVNISLNSFEIIINFGININERNSLGYIPLNYMYRGPSEHKQNIIGLFVKHGADLNSLDSTGKTILDSITGYGGAHEHHKIIMTLIDFGARTNNPYKNKDVLEFIESYRDVNIKPAIKK